MNPAYLHVILHPAEVAASLLRRDAFSMEKSCCLWLGHLLDAEQGSRQGPRTFLFYEALLADPVREAAQVAAALGVTWPNPVESVAADLRTILSPDLQHHADACQEHSGPWSEVASALYRALQEAGPAGLDDETWSEFHARVAAFRGDFDPVLVEHLGWEAHARIHWENRTYGLWGFAVLAFHQTFEGPAACFRN